MSLIYTVDVECDHPGCMTWVDGYTQHGRPDAAKARRSARASGFVRRDGQDYCPKHAERPQP